MAEPRHRPTSTPPGASSRLPALTPAGRELLEVLWRAGRPLTTRQLHDAIGRAFPHRAGRQLQTVSTLLAELMAQGWVAGEKHGGTRWVYRPAVSRDEGLTQIARWVVEEFSVAPGDGWHLVREVLLVVDLEDLIPAGWAPRQRVRRAKGAAAQPVSDVPLD